LRIEAQFSVAATNLGITPHEKKDGREAETKTKDERPESQYNHNS